MEGIQNGTPACRGATHAAPVQFQGEAARLTCLNVSSDQSADINIYTAEGDKVTLSSDYHAEATLLTYEHLAYSNTGYEAEKGQLVDCSEERNVSLSVKGALSDQEMADIQALLNDLGGMLKNFLTGGGKEGGGVDENAADLSRYSSLSGFEADFEVRASMQYLNLEGDQLAVEGVVSPKPLKSATASLAPALPLTATVAPPTLAPAAVAAQSIPEPVGLPVAPVAVETSKPAAAQDEHAAQRMAKKVRDSGLRPKRFMKLLKRFLRGLMQEMRANNAIDGEKAKRGESILEKFFGQLEQASGASEVQATKVSLKQQQVSLQYEMKAEVRTLPCVEETV